jgi:hypothetical protein
VTTREQTESERPGSTPTEACVVYGVVHADAAPDGLPDGIAGAPVRVVAGGGLGALVSRVEGPQVRATRRDLLSHSRVLERALAAGPVLPLRFGTVLADEDSVVSDVLEAHRDELKALLDRFESKVELRVKGFYVEEQVLREVLRADPAIARLSESTRGLPESAGYGARVRLGEAVARAVEATRSRDAGEIVGRLRVLADEVAFDEEAREGVAVAASFLVDRDRVAAFDERMDELARRHEGRIRFKYLGPLPPHSFVSLAEGAVWVS